MSNNGNDNRLIEDFLPAEAPVQVGIVAARFYNISAQAIVKMG